MEKIKYSIITANYNGYKLMEKYFVSLENQLYKNFEIIIVDDSSNDNSYEELIKYKNSSKLDIKILKTEKNCGPGYARNIGINNCKGEYITFVDNDDWIEFDTLMIVNKILQKKNYDCLIYDYYLDTNKREIINHSVYGQYSGNILKEDAIRYIRNHTVCKFYKKDIIEKNNIKFPELKRHEDIAFVGKILTKCNTFYYLDRPLYHYVQYKNSLSNTKKLDERSLIDAVNIVKKEYGNIYRNEFEEKSVMDLLYSVTLLMCKKNYSYKKIHEFIENYNKEFPKWYNYDIVNYVGKSKKFFLFCVRHKYIFTLKFLTFIHSILTII